MLECVEGVTDAEKARGKDNNNTSANVTNDVTTRREPAVSFPDETEEHPYRDAIFRLGKV